MSVCPGDTAKTQYSPHIGIYRPRAVMELRTSGGGGCWPRADRCGQGGGG